MNLEEHLPKFELISEAASKEASLERNLEKMKVEWLSIQFQVVALRWNQGKFCRKKYTN